MIPDAGKAARPLVVITGGQGGLGKVIAEELERANYRVMAPGRGDLDVTSQDSVDLYFRQFKQPIDLLINNAGCLRDKALLNLSIEDWELVVDTHLKGAWRCAQSVLPPMIEARKGHLIAISSFSALSGPIGQSAYAASKAGLLALTQSLAAEFGEFNVRSNAILPGFLETPMTKNLPCSRIDAIRNDHDLKRFNTPAAVARFVRFLHEELENVSGQIFQLDSRRRRPGW